MHANLISLCRICLENGAALPIFQTSDSSILSKMSRCFGDKIEDVNGYPQKICETCNKMLDKAYDFINQYTESCKILEKNAEMVIKVEPMEISQCKDPCDIYEENLDAGHKTPREVLLEKKEISVKILKKESLENLDFSDWSDDNTELKIKTHVKKNDSNKEQTNTIKAKTKRCKIIKNCEDSATKAKRQRITNINNNVQTGLIVSSLLEGKFTWSNGQWSLVTPVTNQHQRVKKESLLETKQSSQNNNNKNLNKKICRAQHKKIKSKHEEKNVRKRSKQSRKEPNLCDHCGKVFSSKDSVTKHLALLNISPRQFQCTLCPRTFKTQLYLNQHCGRVHNQVEKKFMCSVCGHAFAYLKDLNTHSRNVHNEEFKKLRKNRLFYCKMCGKSFKNGVAVTIHTRSAHTGERPAVCTVCDAKFFHEDYLKQHMRLHTGETPFKCPICYRGYAQRCNMLSHVKHNHRKSQCDETLLKSLKPFVLKAMQP